MNGRGIATATAVRMGPGMRSGGAHNRAGSYGVLYTSSKMVWSSSCIFELLKIAKYLLLVRIFGIAVIQVTLINTSDEIGHIEFHEGFP